MTTSKDRPKPSGTPTTNTTSSTPRTTRETGESATSSPNYNTPKITKFASMDGPPNMTKYSPSHPDLQTQHTQTQALQNHRHRLYWATAKSRT